MVRIMKAKGRKLNKNKIRIMVASRNKNPNPLTVKIRRVRIKEIKEFEYLGSKITRDGRSKCEIKSGIA